MTHASTLSVRPAKPRARGALDAGLRAAWISAGRSTPDDGHDAERLRVFTTIDAFFDHVESATGEEDAWCRFEE